MKRPTMLLKVLLAELGGHLGLSTERDAVEIQRRVEHEGLSFLTITLPLLSDALERGLESGLLSCPSNFSRHGSLPRLLGGFFRSVFDRSGELLGEPCVDSIYAIRQICRFYKKLKIDCSQPRLDAAIKGYLKTEGELRSATSNIIREDDVLDELSGILWTQVFPEFDYTGLVCRHGPGVTADRLSANARNRIRQWPDRSELLFPSDLHAYPNYGWAAEAAREEVRESGIEFLGIRDEPGVRVVFVPKTLKAPRVIAIEPSHMQFMQQAVMQHVVPLLEEHRLTKDSVRFTDQRPNQLLAHQASIDGRLATIDLSEASDRVHFRLVQRIFRKTAILEYFEDCRSMHATLPDGTNVILEKFASMGSALCFPVEAMVFYTLIQRSFHCHYGVRPTSSSIERFSALIDIYGDDIIVPVEDVDHVVATLESYGLKVNVHKSFRFSQFRESCGGDFYAGTDVKPVYASELPFDRLRDWLPETVVSWAEKSDQFYLKGLWKTAQAIRDLVSEATRTTVPRSRRPGAGLRFLSLLFDTECRYNNKLYRYEQKRICYEPVRKPDSHKGSGVSLLNQWGLSRHSLRLRSSRYDDRGHNDNGRDLSRVELRLQQVCDSGYHLVAADAGALEVDSSEVTEQLLPADWQTKAAYRGLLAKSHGSTRFVQPLDFDTSVKRGSFKSKCRWVAC